MACRRRRVGGGKLHLPLVLLPAATLLPATVDVIYELHAKAEHEARELEERMHRAEQRTGQMAGIWFTRNHQCVIALAAGFT